MKQVMVFALTVTATLAFAQTIAVFDMEEVLAKHPNTPKDKEQLELTMADYSKERDALREELNKKEELIRKKIQDAQNPMLSPTKVEEIRKECMKIQEELETAAATAENQMRSRAQQLSELEKRLIKRTSDAVNTLVAAYAKEKGIDLVLYKNVVPYCAESMDITAQIVALCGGEATVAAQPEAPVKPQPTAEKKVIEKQPVHRKAPTTPTTKRKVPTQTTF